MLLYLLPVHRVVKEVVGVDKTLGSAVKLEERAKNFKVLLGLVKSLTFNVGQLQVHEFKYAREELVHGVRVLVELRHYKAHEGAIVGKRHFFHSMPQVLLHLANIER